MYLVEIYLLNKEVHFQSFEVVLIVPFHSKQFITHSFIKMEVFWDVTLKMKAYDSLKHLQLCTN